MAFIFGGNTNETQADIQRNRRLADAMIKANSRLPRNGWEGANAVVGALVARKLNKGASEAESQMATKAAEMYPEMASKSREAIAQSLLRKSLPLATGGGFTGGGGGGNDILMGSEFTDRLEAGEPLQKPAQPTPQEMETEKQRSKVLGDGYDAGYESTPNAYQMSEPPEPDQYMLDEMGQEEFDLYRNMNRDQRLQYMNDPTNGFVSQGANDAGAEMLLGGAGEDGLAGITKDDFTAGQKTKVQDAAFAYTSLMKNFEEYEKLFKDGGSTAWPGKRKDALGIAHRNLQMQMKELYNLGVLNGPDLQLMNEILIEPTSISGNVMDALGVADMDERIPANIEQVRKLMRNLAEPKLKAGGIDINALAPPKQQSDADFLKELGLE